MKKEPVSPPIKAEPVSPPIKREPPSLPMRPRPAARRSLYQTDLGSDDSDVVMMDGPELAREEINLISPDGTPPGKTMRDTRAASYPGHNRAERREARRLDRALNGKYQSSDSSVQNQPPILPLHHPLPPPPSHPPSQPPPPPHPLPIPVTHPQPQYSLPPQPQYPLPPQPQYPLPQPQYQLPIPPPQGQYQLPHPQLPYPHANHPYMANQQWQWVQMHGSAHEPPLMMPPVQPQIDPAFDPTFLAIEARGRLIRAQQKRKDLDAITRNQVDAEEDQADFMYQYFLRKGGPQQ
jgi:hypothetical protein